MATDCTGCAGGDCGGADGAAAGGATCIACTLIG
jgi:hypothetical protein